MLAYSAKDLVAKIPVVGALGGGLVLAATEGSGAFPFVEAGALAIIVGVLLNQTFAHQKRIEAASTARESVLTERLEKLHDDHKRELASINERVFVLLAEVGTVLKAFQSAHPCALGAIAPEAVRTITQLQKMSQTQKVDSPTEIS